MPPPNSASVRISPITASMGSSDLIQHGTPTLSPTPAPQPLSRSSNSASPASAESDNAHDDNVSFLRSRSVLSNPILSSLNRHRRPRHQIPPPPPPRPMEDDDRIDLDDPSMSLSVEINRRIPIVRRQREQSRNMPNYEGRISNTRSLYGWAPGSDDEDDDAGEDSDDDAVQPFLHAVSDGNAAPERSPRNEPTGRTPPIISGDEPTEGRSRFRNPPITTMEALLQSARRQPRLARTRTLESYLLERYSDRPSQIPEDGERAAPSASRAYRYRPPNDPHRPLTHNDLRARAAAHRQLHLDNSGNALLKETINYLDRLRYSNSYEESLSSAAERGFISMDNLSSWKDNDLVLDTGTIAPPPACSWLRPGMVFSGCQRAASAGCSVLSQRVPSPHAPSDPVIVNGSDSARISVYTTSGRRYLANSRDENWPVKVTIHNINHEDMTLAGTMEAYNIPDKTSPTHDAHIVTFLEGEIIDFNAHTLETKNFKADADIDSTYWRELQPFKDLTEDQMVKNLVSRKWITEQLAQGWILMRWKERCFITPTNSRQGLTISGFYYISLRRDNGHIEGLYYDPGSSPYQQLSLKPEIVKMVQPSYTFR
ncbi:hypothetical protein NUU61_009180 [Penicillium alfredii]|uniref:Vacuolar import and degradation protein-domain-containing protein n=1 Tax=Penicillium alfredii TaxID=1506179 RepID=A0A9W9JX49_9EURO|nr:uncharacterized protein NUU61_009180 [Penicillium alfredii]KAJ5084601.1 hypothetical protein NUU61_009180 [Penicillium alfredii]